MSIVQIDNYIIIEEQKSINDLNSVSEQLSALLLDLGADPTIAHQLFSYVDEDIFSKALSVSFISAYKDTVTPHCFGGVAFVIWVQPKDYSDDEYLNDSTEQVCVPLFVVIKTNQMFEDAPQVIDKYIEIETEARKYSEDLGKLLNL